MVRTVAASLGGRPVPIAAPRAGTWDEGTAQAFSRAFPAGGLYGLDTESTWLGKIGQFDRDFRARLVQLAARLPDPGPGDPAALVWVLDVTDPAQRAAAVAVLAEQRNAFASHSQTDVLTVATRLGVDIVERNVDTLNLARIADPDKDRDRDLKTLTGALLGPELEQAEAELNAEFKRLWTAAGGRANAKREEIAAYGWATIPADDERYLRYAGLDAAAVLLAAPELVRATRAPRRLLEVDHFLATRAARIQLRGMRVDTAALDELEAEALRETSEAKTDFAQITGGVNAQYSAGVVEWFGQHGVDWSTWGGSLTSTGAPSLAKENVGLLADYPLDASAQVAVTALRRFKGHLDLRNKTKGVREHLAPDGRVHPVLHPTGASTTARMSSSGPNFQNFSKRDPRMRGLFLPEPGHVLVTIDFDQVELRVVAALAREEKMISTILAGGDLHQLTVDELAAIGIEISRDAGKMANFLIVYGGGGKALHEQSGIPLGEAMEIVAAHRERYTAIAAYTQYLGLEREAVRTISGRRLPVTRVKGSGDRAGDLRTYANVNYAVQSAARELLVGAWWRFDVEYGMGSTLWFPVHDELVLQVPEDQVTEVTAAAEACMRFDFRGVPISATAVELRDERGESRWMTSRLAEKYAATRAAAA